MKDRTVFLRVVRIVLMMTIIVAGQSLLDAKNRTFHGFDWFNSIKESSVDPLVANNLETLHRGEGYKVAGYYTDPKAMWGHSVAWHPTGKFLACGIEGNLLGGTDKQTGNILIARYNPVSGQLIFADGWFTRENIYNLAWSKDGTRLAAATNRAAITFNFDPEEGVLTQQGYFDNPVRSRVDVSWHPVHQNLLLECGDYEETGESHATVINVDDGVEVASLTASQPPTPPSGFNAHRATSCTWSADGNFCFVSLGSYTTGWHDAEVFQYDHAAGTLTHVAKIDSNTHHARRVSLSPDNTLLVVANERKAAYENNIVVAPVGFSGGFSIANTRMQTVKLDDMCTMGCSWHPTLPYFVTSGSHSIPHPWAVGSTQQTDLDAIKMFRVEEAPELIGGERVIRVVHLPQMSILPPAFGAMQVGWSPDGSVLAFTHLRQGASSGGGHTGPAFYAMTVPREHQLTEIERKAPAIAQAAIGGVSYKQGSRQALAAAWNHDETLLATSHVFEDSAGGQTAKILISSYDKTNNTFTEKALEQPADIGPNRAGVYQLAWGSNNHLAVLCAVAENNGDEEALDQRSWGYSGASTMRCDLYKYDDASNALTFVHTFKSLTTPQSAYNEGGFPRELDWKGDLVYISLVHEASLFKFDQDVGRLVFYKKVPLAAGEKSYDAGGISSDGKYLAATVMGGGEHRIRVYDIENLADGKLSSFDAILGMAISEGTTTQVALMWHPTEPYFVVRNEVVGISSYKYDSATGQVERISSYKTPRAAMFPKCFSSDGGYVIVSTDHWSQREFYGTDAQVMYPFDTERGLIDWSSPCYLSYRGLLGTSSYQTVCSSKNQLVLATGKSFYPFVARSISKSNLQLARDVSAARQEKLSELQSYQQVKTDDGSYDVTKIDKKVRELIDEKARLTEEMKTLNQQLQATQSGSSEQEALQASLKALEEEQTLRQQELEAERQKDLATRLSEQLKDGDGESIKLELLAGAERLNAYIQGLEIARIYKEQVATSGGDDRETRAQEVVAFTEKAVAAYDRSFDPDGSLRTRLRVLVTGLQTTAAVNGLDTTAYEAAAKQLRISSYSPPSQTNAMGYWNEFRKILAQRDFSKEMREDMLLKIAQKLHKYVLESLRVIDDRELATVLAIAQQIIPDGDARTNIISAQFPGADLSVEEIRAGETLAAQFRKTLMNLKELASGVQAVGKAALQIGKTPFEAGKSYRILVGDGKYLGVADGKVKVLQGMGPRFTVQSVDGGYQIVAEGGKVLSIFEPLMYQKGVVLTDNPDQVRLASPRLGTTFTFKSLMPSESGVFAYHMLASPLRTSSGVTESYVMRKDTSGLKLYALDRKNIANVTSASGMPLVVAFEAA
jgi:6-phosphogluconolactonase (cycloisomerase 2 family)